MQSYLLLALPAHEPPMLSIDQEAGDDRVDLLFRLFLPRQHLLVIWVACVEEEAIKHYIVTKNHKKKHYLPSEAHHRCLWH